jgi:hypothetical protein
VTENKSRLDRSIWHSADGHLHTSIPTTVPSRWTPASTGRNDQLGREQLVYVSGDYVIKRESRGRSAWTYVLHRNRVPIGLGASRLKDAKAHAVKNARGEETVNVA